VAFGDFIRTFFNRRKNPELITLEEFARARKGVEGYVEPQTATSPTTLLLIDRDGDHRRGAVREAQDAVDFCERLGIPVYDAQVIGYPQRMRDFEHGRRDRTEEVIDKEIDNLEERFRET
jgi:hypothetical protein